MFENDPYRHLLDRLADTYSNREAVVCGDQRLSYDELRDRRDLAERALLERRIGRGSVVVTALGNDPDFIAIFFAVMKVEAVLVPCDIALDAETLADRVREVKADLILMGDRRQIDEAEALSGVCSIVLVNVADARYPDLFDAASENKQAASVDKGDACGTAFTDGCGAGHDDVRLIAFTSGSTGVPKGAQLSEQNLFEPSRALANRLGLNSEDTVLMPLPLSHMFGLVTGMLSSLLAGSKIILMEKFDPKRALELIDEEQVTVNHAVPTMLFRELAILSEDSVRQVVDVSSLRTGMAAGSFVSAKLVERVQSEMGCSLVSAYGSTETVNVTCGYPDDPLETRARYVGKPTDGVSLRIVDANGHEVAAGETGELCVKGPGVMRGYLGASRIDADAFDQEGWFHTGDMASVAEGGYVSLCGRKKDLIIRCGNNIVPSMLEAAFSDCPDVVEACVIGYPDNDLGEKVILFVVLSQNAPFDEEAIRASARGRIPRFAVPDKVIPVESMPHLASGKIDRAALAKLLG